MPRRGGGVAIMKRMECKMSWASFSLIATTTLFIAAIGAKGRAIVDTLAPVGYEDEPGFHFGSLRTRPSASSVRFGSGERLMQKNKRGLTASLNKRATKHINPK